MNKCFPALLFATILLLLSAFTIPENWVSFQKKDYIISFPGKPTNDSMVAKTELGGIKVYRYSYESKDPEKDSTIGYQLIKTSFPAKIPLSTDSIFLKAFFESTVKTTLARVKGKLLSEKEIMFSNYPGRDLIIALSDGGGVMSRMRIILAGQTVFALQTVSATGKENNTDAARFYNSFSIK